jgi:hypothetical protein
MSILRTPTPAPVTKTKDVKRIATFYAAILVIMAVAQLFTFESFLQLVVSFDLPGDIRGAYFTAALIIIVEVFALPFLLRMPLSSAFRWVSMVCGWLVALLWLFVTVWLAVQDDAVSTVGFLGTVIDMMPGWWAIFISITFGILVGWASWGMWPRQTKEHRKKKLFK